MNVNQVEDLDQLFEDEISGYVVDFKPESKPKCDEQLQINDILKIERNLTALKKYRTSQTQDIHTSSDYSFSLYKKQTQQSNIKIKSPKKPNRLFTDDKNVPIRNLNTKQLYIALKNQQMHPFELPSLQFGGMTVKTLDDMKNSGRQSRNNKDSIFLTNTDFQ